jgi:hypothetical protein
MFNKAQRQAEHRAALKEAFRQACLVHFEAKTQGRPAAEVERLAATVHQLKRELDEERNHD